MVKIHVAAEPALSVRRPPEKLVLIDKDVPRIPREVVEGKRDLSPVTLDREQFVVLVEVDRDQTGAANVGEFRERRFLDDAAMPRLFQDSR